MRKKYIFALYEICNSAPFHTRYLANLQLVMLALCGGHVMFPSRGRGGGHYLQESKVSLGRSCERELFPPLKPLKRLCHELNKAVPPKGVPMVSKI